MTPATNSIYLLLSQRFTPPESPKKRKRHCMGFPYY